MGLCIAFATGTNLGLEALTLIHRVVQLAESVADLFSADERFEAGRQMWPVRKPLGQRRDLHWIVCDESRLDEVRGNISVEAFVQQRRPAILLHAAQVQLLTRLARLLVRVKLLKIYAGRMMDRFHQRDALPRRLQADFVPPICERERTVDCLGSRA